jgi:type I restriction enzyme M protein
MSKQTTHPTIVDYISGQVVPAGDEEINATQALSRLLVENLGWERTSIRTRPQWQVPASPSEATKRELGRSFRGFPCDIVLFGSSIHNVESIRIICECKKLHLQAGIEQLKILLNHEPQARIGIWYNGEEHAIVYRDGRGGYEVDRTAPLPRPTESLEYGRAKRVYTYVDLEPAPSLKLLFEDVRDFVAAQDSRVNRDEFILIDLANLLMCKLLDERDRRYEVSQPMQFQLQAPESATPRHIRTLFEQIKASNPALFPDATEELRIADESIIYIVGKMQGYRLLGHSRQSVGDAFQVLRGRAVKGDEGQYFTPGPVVRAAVRIANPTSRERAIDPACGTGGFVTTILDYVYSTLERALPAEEAAAQKQRWASERLFAVDKDAVSVRFAKSYLALLNNGSHVYQADSLRTQLWSGRRDDLALQIQDHRFDVILTNPPFGDPLRVSIADSLRMEYQFGMKWIKVGSQYQPQAGEFQDQQLGVIFLERCLQLLANNGRLGIVIPETWLFSKDFAWLVDHLTRSYTITHVINLPMVTFEEFCRAKTCLLFLTNKRPSPEHRIIFSVPNSIGFDKRGHVLYKDIDGEISNEVDDELSIATDVILRGNAESAAEERFYIPIEQEKARAKGILAPTYYWRKPYLEALQNFCIEHSCDTITLGELVDQGRISVRFGHGSPPSRYYGRGTIPYIKVSDIKNWRIIENPSFYVPEEQAQKTWGKNGPGIMPFELITPSRTSQNIGMWAVVMPWQTQVVFTKEFLRLRVEPCEQHGDILDELSYAYLLYVMSLKVVREQYSYLVLMQTNREDLGSRWREVAIPIKRDGFSIWADPVQTYISSTVAIQQARQAIFQAAANNQLADRPL